VPSTGPGACAAQRVRPTDSPPAALSFDWAVNLVDPSGAKSVRPDLARAMGVPADALEQTARRYNTMAEAGRDDDFQRGDSAYERHFGDSTAPNPNFGPVDSPPYIAVRLVLRDLGTSGGLVTDEHARVLRTDGSIIEGLYAVGNTSAGVMGRTYARAGATISSAMTFGYVAALRLAGRLGDDQEEGERNAESPRSGDCP
jgi:FAD binding domain